jgi:hypothetical protein
MTDTDTGRDDRYSTAEMNAELDPDVDRRASEDTAYGRALAYARTRGEQDSDICDAYEAAFSQAVEDEIARAARATLEGGE